MCLREGCFTQIASLVAASIGPDWVCYTKLGPDSTRWSFSDMFCHWNWLVLNRLNPSWALIVIKRALHLRMEFIRVAFPNFSTAPIRWKLAGVFAFQVAPVSCSDPHLLPSISTKRTANSHPNSSTAPHNPEILARWKYIRWKRDERIGLTLARRSQFERTQKPWNNVICNRLVSLLSSPVCFFDAVMLCFFSFLLFFLSFFLSFFFFSVRQCVYVRVVVVVVKCRKRRMDGYSSGFWLSPGDWQEQAPPWNSAGPRQINMLCIYISE